MPSLAIALAACFLFLCPPHRHHAHHRHHAPAARVTAVSCDEIVQAFRLSGNDQDTFVRSYPQRKQHDVLVCLDQGDQ